MPASQTIEIVNPVAPPPTLRVLEADKPTGLVGKRVGFRVQWKKFEVFMKELETILREEYGVSSVYWWKILGGPEEEVHGRAKNPAAFAEANRKLAENSDCAILGLAC
jgi:hypothetical protein